MVEKLNQSFQDGRIKINNYMTKKAQIGDKPISISIIMLNLLCICV